MSAEELLNSLIGSARSQERHIHDELTTLKERQSQVMQHRMELESVADALKAEALAKAAAQ